ncbi:unnamed protein product [Lupinus luteus]|uniref:RING-type domain-containing protein n=1 Tax=Lupinus luteus TaxID=3873 RepID=A0AAV1Y7K0_LUPLU
MSISIKETMRELFYQLYAKTIILLIYMLIELILVIRYLKSYTKPIVTKTQYHRFIEEKNPTICFTRRLRLDHNECMVCLTESEEGEKVRKLECKHTFHKDCLDKWLHQYCATCPLCRKNVFSDDVVIKYQVQVQVQNEVGYYDGNDLISLLSALRGGSVQQGYDVQNHIPH